METIRKGSKGDAVRQLQGLLQISADGIFGPKTKAAVIAYQAANALTPDGVCGPKTWAKLLGEEEVNITFVQPVDYKQYDSRWATAARERHYLQGAVRSDQSRNKRER